ncbi:hypothetical protein TanjilG_20342 [Lupinus angustifolius]|uniref:CUE domain-containing protein n=1 Tax=Lupinus angustifolius TaxID=3871 RepID=A0A4P1RVT7_LUPAN|nr:PREDICTED: uncharacterized protein LOC109348975 isoform X1 [Lupinus angustifolius]OIW19217.1 hypothetical protein TanjilG_20342 [Lupinus angustifolius]
MSAAVCGNKRAFLEELPPSPPLSKRLRCSSSTSPIRFSLHSLIDHLRNLFPHMDHHLYERALQESDYDLDAAVKRLNELCLGTADGNSGTAEGSNITVNVHTAKLEGDGDASASENQPAMNNLPVNGAEWVEFFVREMSVATNVDDARGRVARMLAVLEKSISARASADATEVLHKENLMLKQQIEVLIKEKNSFKNAFRIQHERLSDYEEKNQELQHLKQLVPQCQEKIRTLEMNNYTLGMHLNQAQQNNNPFNGRFPPDVF